MSEHIAVPIDDAQCLEQPFVGKRSHVLCDTGMLMRRSHWQYQGGLINVLRTAYSMQDIDDNGRPIPDSVHEDSHTAYLQVQYTCDTSRGDLVHARATWLCGQADEALRLKYMEGGITLLGYPEVALRASRRNGSAAYEQYGYRNPEAVIVHESMIEPDIMTVQGLLQLFQTYEPARP